MNYVDENESEGAWRVLKQVVGVLLDEAIPGELPVRSRTRFALTAWLLFAFIVGTVYRSNLTASLTAPKFPPRPETLADLVDMGYTATTPTDMELIINDFRTSDSQMLRTLSETIEYVPSYKEGLLKSFTEKKAYIYERLYLEMKVAEGFTQRDGSTPLYVTQRNVLPGYAAFPLMLDAPFKTNMDSCLIAIHGAGLITQWTKEVVSEVRRDSRMRIRTVEQNEESSSDDGVMPLTMVHMQGPLFLYLACVIFSLACFVREMVAKVWHPGSKGLRTAGLKRLQLCH